MSRLLLLYFTCCITCAMAQAPATPDKMYGQLFHDVQTAKIFPDGKTFVDCVPKRDPAEIAADYKKLKDNPAVRYSLKLFVEANFELPQAFGGDYKSDIREGAAVHVRNLWKVLKREADKSVTGSSLLALPYPYIVPGGRFREIYYWDSYFTMLGLQESGEWDLIESMIKNFAYLIRTYGHIPNGNRSYYLSRSQPPFFALMVSLLAEKKGDGVISTYLPELEKEYAFWMEGAATLKPGQANKRVSMFKDGSILNRYWDDEPAPRQESYLEDMETARNSGRDLTEMYRHLKAGAESGWDFSSRWFGDARRITTIQTTGYLPVDLNCLLYTLEMTIAKGRMLKKEGSSTEFSNKAAKRKTAILNYCWNKTLHFFTDYNVKLSRADTVVTPAGLYPLFVQIATTAQAKAVAEKTKTHLLKSGGIITSNNNTGQQWDAPNGWAPLQWITIKGLDNYGQKELWREIARRWIALNEKVFNATGKMMEKYNVLDTNVEAGGGEYPSQDGFGWTNGVYLKLVGMYKNDK